MKNKKGVLILGSIFGLVVIIIALTYFATFNCDGFFCIGYLILILLLVFIVLLTILMLLVYIISQIYKK